MLGSLRRRAARDPCRLINPLRLEPPRSAANAITRNRRQNLMRTPSRKSTSVAEDAKPVKPVKAPVSGKVECSNVRQCGHISWSKDVCGFVRPGQQFGSELKRNSNRRFCGLPVMSGQRWIRYPQGMPTHCGSQHQPITLIADPAIFQRSSLGNSDKP